MTLDLRHVIYELTEEELANYLSEKEIRMILWSIAKEYEIAIANKEIIPIKKTEFDREIINKLQKVITRLDEKLLDMRVLIDFATMIKVRDYELLLKSKTKIERLYILAQEVKKRATPVIFLPGYPMLKEMYDSYEFKMKREKIVESKKENEQINKLLTILKESNVAYTSCHKFTNEELDNMKEKIIKKLANKTFTFRELTRILTAWELDLLSQMIQNNEIKNEIILPDKIRFGKTSSSGIQITITLRVEQHNE